MSFASPLSGLPLILFDGACGTSLQRLQLPPAAWDGHDGCNEYLNLSCPGAVTAMHRAYDAGHYLAPLRRLHSQAACLT